MHFLSCFFWNVDSLDFPPTYQNWEVTDPMDLFQAPVLKSESNPKVFFYPCHFWTSNFWWEQHMSDLYLLVQLEYVPFRFMTILTKMENISIVNCYIYYLIELLQCKHWEEGLSNELRCLCSAQVLVSSSLFNYKWGEPKHTLALSVRLDYICTYTF